MKNEILKEMKKIAKKYVKKEELIKRMFWIAEKEGFNEKECIEKINEFFYLSKTCPSISKNIEK